MPPTPDLSGASSPTVVDENASEIATTIEAKPGAPPARTPPPAEDIVYLRCDEASARVFECDRRDLCERSSVFQQIYGKFMKTDAPRVILLRGVEPATLLKLHDALVHGNALVLHHERPGYDRLAKLFKLSKDCRVNTFPWDHPQEQCVARTRVYRKLDASKPWKQLEITYDGQKLVCQQTISSPKKS